MSDEARATAAWWWVVESAPTMTCGNSYGKWVNIASNEDHHD